MMAHTGLTRRPGVHAHRRPFYKGLAVSVPLHLVAAGARHHGRQAGAAAWRHYAGERFIRVMPLRDPATLETGFFDVQACNDSNRVDIFVFANEQQAVLMARLDNLGKGASGAAVQA
jgi:N-acetyl-gamma-glutamyl-phosphate reductase